MKATGLKWSLRACDNSDNYKCTNIVSVQLRQVRHTNCHMPLRLVHMAHRSTLQSQIRDPQRSQALPVVSPLLKCALFQSTVKLQLLQTLR
eukprot:jgi/Botrbrau1/1656/Bobra.0185s0066.1